MQTPMQTLWRRWILANALAETVGLGATFGAIALLSARIESQQTAGVLIAFAIAVASGALEATAVGLAQWWAMNPWFPRISRFAWWRATVIGATAGYILGYLPSTLIGLGNAASQTPTVELPQWLVLLLAAGLGAVAGAVLSFAQWWVLRRRVHRAGLWIPANMLAWALGMPIIFAGLDLAFRQRAPWQSGLVVGAALLTAGAAVGTVHGRFLVALATADRAKQ